jgi:DNA-binding NtrC family response regulator
MSVYQLLIIDDEEDILRALTRLLHDPEYRIQCAPTAEQALAIAQNVSLDLIISDYRLGPGMNGLEVLAEITKAQPEVVCILLTGYADVQVAMDAINTIGLYKFMLKPWDNNDLLITVRRALEQLTLIRENRRLLTELKNRETILDQLEKEHPGISKIPRDAQGRIKME